MRDKIAGAIDPFVAGTQKKEITQAILDLIASELPKEKADGYCENLDFQIGLKQIQAIPRWSQDKIDGYNQCLKDIKHKLEGE